MASRRRPSNFEYMEFAGELDMIQDQTSAMLSKESRHSVSTPATSKGPPVSRRKSDPFCAKANTGEIVQKAQQKCKEFDLQGNGTSSGNARKRAMSYDPALLKDADQHSYRYTVAGYRDEGPTLAGELDMLRRTSIDWIKTNPFVSRMPNYGLRGDKKPFVYPGKDYVPKRHKAKIVVWADLTVDAVDRLNESLNADHIKQVLADIFMLDNYKDSLKVGIVMDLYYYTLQFARTQSFSPEKTSAFFSIIKKVFEVCIETPFGNLDHTFEYFKDLIHCHSVNRPPYSIELFTPDEVRKITEYTINTFFRHFKMYKYAFTPMVRLDLAINYIGMPPSPPPTEADAQETDTPGGDETPLNDEGKEEELDEEKQAAREELKNMVKNFLMSESKKIEGNVDHQVKSAVEALNNKIDQMTDSPPKAEGKGKKK